MMHIRHGRVRQKTADVFVFNGLCKEKASVIVVVLHSKSILDILPLLCKNPLTEKLI